MKVEDAGLSEEKRELIQDLSDEYDAPVKIVSGWTAKLTYPVHQGGACLKIPGLESFIVLQLDFLRDLSLKSVEHLILHEIGHKVLYRMSHEEFAEKFAVKHFSGSREDYGEAWASKMYWLKSKESLDNVEIGDDFL